MGGDIMKGNVFTTYFLSCGFGLLTCSHTSMAMNKPKLTIDTTSNSIRKNESPVSPFIKILKKKRSYKSPTIFDENDYNIRKIFSKKNDDDEKNTITDEKIFEEFFDYLKTLIEKTNITTFYSTKIGQKNLYETLLLIVAFDNIPTVINFINCNNQITLEHKEQLASFFLDFKEFPIDHEQKITLIKQQLGLEKISTKTQIPKIKKCRKNLNEMENKDFAPETQEPDIYEFEDFC